MKNTKLIQAKSALNHLKSQYLPYEWDLNIYRGCSHKCSYCYALYSHQYLDEDDFFNSIYVKTNIAEVLEKQLVKRTWKKQLINLGGVTDSYQPVEEKFKLMRAVLEILIKYSQPVIISTKSNLILRDFDLINELSQKAKVYIAVSLITTDQELQKIIEPNTASPKDKLNILKTLKNTKAIVGCHTMPILPYLTDSDKQLDDLFCAVKKTNADYILTGLLNLRGKTKYHFLNFVKNRFSEKYGAYCQLYKYNNKQIYDPYKTDLYARITYLKKKYDLQDYKKEAVIKSDYQQMELFI
ncbi:radical SAM protein [Candidatus Margulisiibacteriota bacterium]